MATALTIVAIIAGLIVAVMVLKVICVIAVLVFAKFLSESAFDYKLKKKNNTADKAESEK